VRVLDFKVQIRSGLPYDEWEGAAGAANLRRIVHSSNQVLNWPRLGWAALIKEKAGVNAGVFIEFLKRLVAGARQTIFLIVNRGPAHRAKKTKALVETLGGKLRLFFLPPYAPDRHPDELAGKHLKADTVGRSAIQGYADFKAKVKSSMHSLQRNAKKIRSFFQKDTLKYAA